MKHIKLSLIFILAFAYSTFSQLEITSKVKAATLFSNKAQIMREVVVQLKEGDNTLQFSGLESSIDNNSVQISGTNGITILSSNIKYTTASKNNQPFAVKTLLDSLKKTQRAEQLARQNIQNLQAEKSMILTNKNANGVNSGFNLDNMLDISEYYRNNLGELDALVYDENIRVNELKEQVKKINESLKDLGYRNGANSLFVTVFSERTQSVSMKLIYLVNNIGWTPFYEIKSNGIGSPINLISKAKINQNSQVDWNNTALTLSTSNPMNYGVLPTVHPWVLRFQGEARSKMFKKDNLAYSNTLESPAAEKYDSKSMASYTTATDNMINTEFSISKLYTISGDAGTAVVELENHNLEGEYVYYTAPKYSKDVFLIAHVDDWEQYNLLPGVANLFLEGTFVGTTMINPNEIADTMNLVLGKDEGIVAKREKIQDVSKQAILGSSKKVDMGIQVSIKNNKGRDIEIIVEDQVPISSNEKIEITLKDISKAKQDESTGKLTWSYKLKAGDSKIHKIKYEVKYPKSESISNF